MRILGISAFYHDSAAALVDGGRIVAAAQEERFTRRKHDAGYPRNAIAACLAQAGTAPADVDRVVFYDKPFLKFERLLETSVAFAPRGLRAFAAALPVWVREKLFQKTLLRRELAAAAPGVDWNERLLFAEHHVSHAASAFYPSPFRDAAVLTLDGVGEWATTAAGVGRGEDLELVCERTLNLKVKHRESFRPFAPSVLREDTAHWFALDRDSPYMLFVAEVWPRYSRRGIAGRTGARSAGVERLDAVRSEIPAVTHVDDSARVQTVRRETNPRLHALLAAFKARTGCPVLVNTSFNVDGEPIVCTPADAFRCFMDTDIERLAVGNCFLRKEEQAGGPSA